MSRQRVAMRLLSAIAVLSLAVAACGDDGESGGGGSVAATSTTQQPRRGGDLKFSLWSWGQGLDPTMTSAYGNFGGTELGAIYDRLVEWNPEAKKYEPKTAESVTANADNTQWTVKLRPNLKFSDGTAYDAAAVKFNFDRHKARNANVRGLLASVTEAQVVDPLTVRFVLSEPWAGFPIVLNNTPGMIASPTAIQKLGDDAMKTNPVGAGAGPFVVDSYKANESLVLKRNTTYWNGEPYLDSVTFTAQPNGNINYELLKSGGANVVYVRDSRVVARARDDKTSGYTAVVGGGEALLINNGLQVACAKGEPAAYCAGKADGTMVTPKTPGQDPKVRQAVAAALDMKEIDKRVNDGKGRPGTAVFDASFPWDPKVALPPYDLEKARRLVTEAKQGGWDGKIRLVCATANDPARQNEALAISAMLQAAGMTVDTTRTNITVTEETNDVIVKRDYDLAGCFGLQITPDDNAVAFLEQNLRSTSPSNRTGYASPAMDAALTELKRASTEQAKIAGFKKIADLWNEGMPQLPLFHTEESVFWSAKVHGIRSTGLYAALLDKAWME